MGETEPTERTAQAVEVEEAASERGRDSATRKFLSFRLAEEDYAVSILQVQEIIGLSKTTLVPNTPPFVLGVINLRGHVVPVLDLRQKFGMPCGERTRTTVNLVVNVGGKTLALLVDAVSEVVALTEDRIAPAPTFGAGAVEADFLEGVAKLEDRLLMLLDLDRLVDFGDEDVERGEAEAAVSAPTSGEPGLV